MKLGVFVAGSALGWILPPNNYTNPCEDFKLSKNGMLSGKTLSIHSVTRGEPECEQLCRSEENCVGFTFIKTKCFLKSTIRSELKSKSAISGRKFKPDYHGDPIKVNLCDIYLKSKQCGPPPPCYNPDIRKKCGPRGLKMDEFYCILPTCECNDETKSYLVNGDILVNDKVNEGKNTRGIWAGPHNPRSKLWTEVTQGGKYVIPYRKTYMPSDSWQVIYDGVRALEKGTCLQFVEYTGQRDYIDIVYSGGCYSMLGRVGGRQELSLGQGCWYEHTVSHEFMHALGFDHEQKRGDQSQYVYIHYGNIPPSLHYAFEVMPANEWEPLGYGYDINSVMQYDGYAFSTNGQPTITVIATGKPVPLNNAVSPGDYAQINALYCGGDHGDGGPGDGGPGGDGGNTGCIDQDENCSLWAQAGECDINPGYMLEYCKKSCNVCEDDTGGDGGGGCVDENQYCADWAQNGECYTNPAYMLEYCKKSCGVCFLNIFG